MNLYGFVGNDGLNYCDPMGEAALLYIHDKATFEKAKQAQAAGSCLYEGVKIILVGRNTWLLAQSTVGAHDDSHKLYAAGKIGGTEGIWFFDNKEHHDAVERIFATYIWTSILSQVFETCSCSGISGLTGLVTTEELGSAAGGFGRRVKPASSEPEPLPSTQNPSPGDAAKSGGKGLGNPFKDKTAAQIDEMFTNKGFTKSGPDPAGGTGGYVNPETGRSYHIDPKEWGKYREPNHVDVNRLRDYKGPLDKKQLPYAE